MLAIKMLKPYYITADDNYIRIVLAYQYFSVILKERTYQFIPMEATEIQIHRRTHDVVNMEANFAFQKGKDIILLSMRELVTSTQFKEVCHALSKPYLLDSEIDLAEVSHFIKSLEADNFKRLVDQALDNRDEALFNRLVTQFV